MSLPLGVSLSVLKCGSWRGLRGPGLRSQLRHQKCEACGRPPHCPCEHGGAGVEWAPSPGLSHPSVPPRPPPSQGGNLEPGTSRKAGPWESRAPKSPRWPRGPNAGVAGGSGPWRTLWSFSARDLQIQSHSKGQGRSWQVRNKCWRGVPSPGGHGPRGWTEDRGAWETWLECSWPLRMGLGHRLLLIMLQGRGRDGDRGPARR